MGACKPGPWTEMILRYRHTLLAIIVLAAFGLMCTVDPIPQDVAYHQFGDAREIGGLPHFWNVVTNIPFLLVGWFGLSRRKRLAEPESHLAYLVLCIGVLLVGLGSAYYHLAPSTPTLVWDRLPMTVAFMALFAILLGERVFPAYRTGLLWLLLAVGAGSVAYWAWTESLGVGDLRAYALVQFLPLLLIPVILLLFEGKYLRASHLVYALLFYAAAKVFEHFDREVLALSGAISGHSIKHVLSAMAALCILLAVPVRKG
jgi:hypothetical protein